MLSALLTWLTRKNSGYTYFPLPKEAQLAYQELKSALMTNPVVNPTTQGATESMPSLSTPLPVIVDASTGTQIDENKQPLPGHQLCIQATGQA